MKKLSKLTLLFIGLMLIALVAAGCTPAADPTEAGDDGGDTGEEMTDEPTEEMMEPFRIAVVSPSATNDLAFSQSMHDAVMIIQEEMGGEDAV